MTELEQLMQPELVVNIDVTNYIGMIELKFGDMFVTPPLGYYTNTSMDPVIQAGKCFYTITDKFKRQPLVSLEGISETVVDNLGNVLVDRKVLATKDAISLNKPFMPYIAALVVEAFVKEHMATMSEYLRHLEQRSNTMLYAFGDMFQEVYKNEQTINNIYSDIDSVLLELVQELDFIQLGKKWHMFDVTRKNKTLVIKRYCDYRVYDWTLTKEIEKEKLENIKNGEIT